jgi:hypothetical protein
VLPPPRSNTTALAAGHPPAETHDHRAVDEPCFVGLGQDPNRHARHLADALGRSGPVAGTPECRGGRREHVPGAQRAGAPHELAHQHPGALHQGLIDTARLVEPPAQPAGLAGACHGVHVLAPRLAFGSLGDEQPNGVGADINCTDTHMFCSGGGVAGGAPGRWRSRG